MAIEISTEGSEDCPVKVSVGDLVIPDAGGEPVDITKRDVGEKKTKGRKKKSEVEVVPGPNQSYLETNTPYHQSYQETDNILRGSIMQLDVVTAEMEEDIRAIRSSKTIRNKYNYISDMTSSMISAISAKVQAARELNNTIKNAHELDLKRMKELKLNENEKDDEKSIMDIYRAFISQPVSTNLSGPFQSPLGATTMDLTVGAVPGALPGNPMQIAMMGQDPDVAYNNYVNNMSPEQLTMMIEDNPNMKHVIAYDQVTGNAEFAVYDQSTGQFVGGVPTRNKDMYMNGMDFDFNAMQAHSNDLNETYDVIFVNNTSPQLPNQQQDGGSNMSQY